MILTTLLALAAPQCDATCQRIKDHCYDKASNGSLYSSSPHFHCVAAEKPKFRVPDAWADPTKVWTVYTQGIDGEIEWENGWSRWPLNYHECLRELEKIDMTGNRYRRVGCQRVHVFYGSRAVQP